MRHLNQMAAMALAVALAACGGGSGQDGGAGAFVTKTTGSVETATQQKMAGVQVAAPTAGRSSVSGSDGRFDLGDLPADETEIVITIGDVTTSITVDLSGGGTAEIEVTVGDGGIVIRISVEHCEGDGAENETSEPLTPVEPGLEGDIKIEEGGDDVELEVEVEELAVGRVIEIEITNLDGVTENLGAFAADDDGEVELEIEAHKGDVLPFGAVSVRELEGFTVTVRDKCDGRRDHGRHRAGAGRHPRRLRRGRRRRRG